MPKQKFRIIGEELQVLHLSLRNKIELKLFGRSKFANLILNRTWRAPLQFYVFKCEKHGIVANYPHHYEQVLDCPVCMRLTDTNIAAESPQNYLYN